MGFETDTLFHAERVAHVCEGFGLGRPERVRPLAGTRNLNFEVAAPLGRWVLRRRCPDYCEPQRIAFDHAALRYLFERGVPVLSPREADGIKTILLVEGTVWEAFPFVQGDPLDESDAVHRTELARNLALFHRVGADFPHRFAKLADRGEADPEVILDLLDRLNTPIGSLYGEWTRRAARAAPDAMYQSLPHTLNHGDIQPANLLFSGGELAAFIDLDWCGMHPRVYDLAYAMLFCCARHDLPFDGGNILSLTQAPWFEAEEPAAFLRAYESEGAPLSGRERSVLAAQVVLTWCHCRAAGAYKVPEEDRAAFLNRPPFDLCELLDPLGLVLD